MPGPRDDHHAKFKVRGNKMKLANWLKSDGAEAGSNAFVLPLEPPA
jgi:hypothetical protein